MPHRHRDRGAAAVEFAIVLPVLLLIIVGMMEFSRLWWTQATLSGAAFEGARTFAITNNRTDAEQVTINAAVNLGVTTDQVEILPDTGCARGEAAHITITYEMDYLTGLFGDTITVVGEGVVRCQG